MESEKVTVLCSNWGCKYNHGGGYYGVCHHPGAQNIIPYAGIDRYYRSTCAAKEVENQKEDVPIDSTPVTKDEVELLGRTPLEE